ncbi:putative cysteine protease atg4 [Amylocarpus encephaloides]|uniref:Cysteine protease n=1 Tax=Amylocarpus encephaloides TaxID=45428 RepID=A0A9P8C040_9HELO|nr:putative cysteine protease atg4 [Amylocarpus encephaloides]
MAFGRYASRLMQYLYDPAPTNDGTSSPPIWCLGQEYQPRENPSPPTPSKSESPPPPPSSDSSSSVVHIPSSKQPVTPPHSTASSFDSRSTRDKARNADVDGGWPPSFLDDFEARIWLTYRSNFPVIPKSKDPSAPSSMSLPVRLRSQLVDQAGFTSDTGWGCMIRSGQSILANSLLMLRLGRDWRRDSATTQERKLLSLFADDPRAPFSIHKFVEHGAESCGKHPGEWFGPSATARCIQALTNNRESSELRVYITGDGADVYEESFMRIAKPDGKTFSPTLVLVGTRLGVDKITPVYWEALKGSLQMPQSMGIAGGRPSSSHYFIGVQGSFFFYLDPHHPRPALPLHADVESYSDEDVNSCHTRGLQHIHVEEMDPSMLIAFLIRDENDWRAWRKAVQEVQGKVVINVADQDPALHGLGGERDGAIDEVETFDDDDDGTM